MDINRFTKIHIDRQSARWMDIKTDRQRYWQKILIHILTDRLTKQETDLYTYRLTDNQAYTWTGIQLKNNQTDILNERYMD